MLIEFCRELVANQRLYEGLMINTYSKLCTLKSGNIYKIYMYICRYTIYICIYVDIHIYIYIYICICTYYTYYTCIHVQGSHIKHTFSNIFQYLVYISSLFTLLLDLDLQ